MGTRTRDAGNPRAKKGYVGKRKTKKEEGEVVGIPTKTKSVYQGNERGGREYAMTRKFPTPDFCELERGDKNVNKRPR
jgi:hypothetical protein